MEYNTKNHTNIDSINFEWDDGKGIVKIEIKNFKNETIYSGKMTGYDFGKLISGNSAGPIERQVDNTKYLMIETK